MSVSGNFGECRLRLLPLAGLAALLHQLRDHSGPARLMTCSHSCSRITMEVLVKQHKVAPMRVGLKLLLVAKHRSAAVRVLQEDVGHASRQLPGNFPKR